MVVGIVKPSSIRRPADPKRPERLCLPGSGRDLHRLSERFLRSGFVRAVDARSLTLHPFIDKTIRFQPCRLPDNKRDGHADDSDNDGRLRERDTQNPLEDLVLGVGKVTLCRGNRFPVSHLV